MSTPEERLAEGLKMALCLQANIENLGMSVPGLSNAPMFKVVKLQADQTIAALRGC